MAHSHEMMQPTLPYPRVVEVLSFLILTNMQNAPANSPQTDKYVDAQPPIPNGWACADKETLEMTKKTGNATTVQTLAICSTSPNSLVSRK
mmetsp:Transcript_1470/g.2346  ORF Transcript_1470/g.2346 Transcript_1470/m.2346 type:complete len:91 (-) Transcript_1470:373-645(-)